jgi:ribosomal protein S8E
MLHKIGSHKIRAQGQIARISSNPAQDGREYTPDSLGMAG